MLLSSIILSWMISNNAKNVLLKRSAVNAPLFADNLNRQVFLQFVLPTVVRYGRIALSEEKQYKRLNQIIRNIIRGMNIDSVTIFDSGENRVSYSTITSLIGKKDIGGLEYKKALEGENSTVLVSGGSLFSLLPWTPEVYCTLKTIVPFRQEDRFGNKTGEIMGVVEITQNLSGELQAIIKLQARIIVFSLCIMAFLSAILGMIVVNANRIMAHRAGERIALEEKLQDSQRLAALGKMVAIVSHEVKNPLGIIRSTAEILKKRIIKVAPENEQLAGIIVEETARLDGIVRNFLDFAGPREVKMERGSLNSVAERGVRLIQPECSKHKIDVTMELDEQMPAVCMDSEQMYQVVFNILFNAVQAMPEGGELQVKTSTVEKEGKAQIAVSDTGEGIAEERLAHIFTPFYTEKNRGTGLGLAIAKSIVDRHSGELRVASKVGRGSCFTITLSTGNMPPE